MIILLDVNGLPRVQYPVRPICHYPGENDESSYEETYSQCAASMERLFSDTPISDEEFALIGDQWSRFESLFVRELLAKGHVINNRG